ncbi:hypothetical protein [Sinorhizobium sp. CCBAU 05631]|uniref:hypothetical protein n=1 Tax=Sinorhizobium sp. CCBAU 05631 TaxID=794846 RepID=UPI00138A055B|nr:hypothetical protein [Sinorhizobium sp. CCBAU 05631]
MSRTVSTKTPVGDETTDRGGLWPRAQQHGICIAALHKKRFPNDQKTIIMHSVDAHGGFPPSSAATTVPLWRFIPSKLMGRGFPTALFSFSLPR